MKVLPIFTILASAVLLSEAASSGPVGHLQVTYIQKCEDFTQHEDFDWQADVINGDNGKELNLKVKLKQDVDEKMKVHLDVDRYNNGEWEKDTYNTDGLMFEDLNKYMPQLFKHLRDQSSPKIDKDNFIPAGDYELNGFRDIEDSLNLQGIMYGSFKIFLYLVNADDVELVCAEIGLDSQEK